MRKALTIILVSFYFLSASGAVVNMHFCCGHLVDWCWNGEAKKCAGAKTNKKCCKDVQLKIEKADDHQSQPATVAPQLVQAPAPLIFQDIEISAVGCERICFLQPDYHAPPPGWKQSMNVAFRVFRI
jgi:hypothetical protein